LRRDNTKEFTPVDDYNPVHKKYVDERTSSMIFEGAQSIYDSFTDEEKQEFFIAIVEPFVELKEEEMVQFNSILGTEEIQTTEIDMTEPEVEEKLDEIIGGEV
jgi:K+/H+ antiporter YhaU regulatory subunit KhtT